MASDGDMIKVGVLTVSDRCSTGEMADKSGPLLCAIINSQKYFPGQMLEQKIVPDVKAEIESTLQHWSDVRLLDLIITTGGTGLAPRDVTPEATKAVIDREVFGMSTAMMTQSLQVTPLAMLSRLVCGTRGRTLIINLPGSSKASQECLSFVAPSISHAVDLLKERQGHVVSTHNVLQQSRGHHCSHDLSVAAEITSIDISQVARRSRKSPYPPVAVSDALAVVLREAWVIGTELVDSHDCRGRTSAEDVFARDPLPPFPASIKDGYAVIASDGVGVRTVLGKTTAGDQPGEVTVAAGTCARITTGAPLPPGADAVVQVEDTRLIKDDQDGRVELEIEILTTPRTGQDIRTVGSDIQAGEMVICAGCRLGAAEIGVLATVGVTQVSAYKLPTVTVLSTGDELQEPWEVLRPGCIRDSNRTTILNLLKEHGIPTVDGGIARDSVDDMVDKMTACLRKADVMVSTGSVSMGEKDYLKYILQNKFQGKIHFGRVLMKPGLPTTFATLELDGVKKLVFALPGNPVSATVTSHLFLLPALRLMSGWPSSTVSATIIQAKITDDIILDSRPEYQRAVLSYQSGQPVPIATGTGNQISSRLLSVRGANA